MLSYGGDGLEFLITDPASRLPGVLCGGQGPGHGVCRSGGVLHREGECGQVPWEYGPHRPSQPPGSSISHTTSKNLGCWHEGSDSVVAQPWLPNLLLASADLTWPSYLRGNACCGQDPPSHPLCPGHCLFISHHLVADWRGSVLSKGVWPQFS